MNADIKIKYLVIGITAALLIVVVALFFYLQSPVKNDKISEIEPNLIGGTSFFVSYGEHNINEKLIFSQSFFSSSGLEALNATIMSAFAASSKGNEPLIT